MGLGLKIGLVLGRNSGSVASGTALTASTLTRTSGVSTYPPTVDFTRPADWQDGDFGVMQRSQDVAFVTGVSESAVRTLLAATTTYDWGLSAIASGVWYFRLGAYRGTRPTSLTWSNIQGVGDAVAPTITSTAAPSGYQSLAGSLALTANKGATWTIVGGADQAQFSIIGSTLYWSAQSLAGTYAVQIQATSYFGVASTTQSITLTLAANTANAFSFTDITGASLSTVYTSNTIVVAGIGSGSIPVTIVGGTYSKNGGAYTSADGTAANGDTFAVRQTSSASNNTTTDVVLTIGSTSDTYSVSTPVVLGSTTLWNTGDAAAGITISGADSLTIASSGAGGTFRAARGTVSKNSGIRQIEFTVSSIGGGANTGIGFAKAGASLTAYIGTDTNGTNYFHTAFVSYNGPATKLSGTTAVTFTAGDKIGAVLNFTAGTVAYYKNGAEMGVWDCAALAGVACFPAFCDQGGGGGVLNTGHSTFTYPISGASPWDL